MGRPENPPSVATDHWVAPRGGRGKRASWVGVAASWRDGLRKGGIGVGSFVGNWESPHCGNRAHKRQLHLRKDHRFEGRDHLSPCPPEKKCIWSGIVHFEGSWSRHGDTIELVVSSKNPAGHDGMFIDRIIWNKSRPVEISDGTECGYTAYDPEASGAK